MAASLEDLKAQIDAAERNVRTADARASESARALKAHWRARAPTLAIGTASALLAWQLVRGRRVAGRRAHAAPRNSWAGTIEHVLRLGGPKLMTMVSALVAGLVTRKTHRPLVTAPAVDLRRYAGTWYEIARLPEKHEKDCASDVTATYDLASDGGLRIVTRCRRRDGSLKRAIGRAEVTDPDTNAELRVSFAPQLLDPLPFVWSDYCILDVAPDYSTAIVGTPDREHLWLLARAPEVGEGVRSAFLAGALAQGFDTSHLVYVRHTAQAPAREPSPQAAMASAAATGEAGPDAAAVGPPTDHGRIDEKQPH